jgi:hypothetical protein
MRILENIPPEKLAQHASDNMLIFTAVLATIIGIILFLLGKKGKQLWMATWGIGLVICSLLLGFFTLSG